MFIGKQMTKLKKYIMAPDVNEASYAGNIGFEEMVKFYQKASQQDIDKMEEIIKNSDWEKFKKMIKRVIGTLLK